MAIQAAGPAHGAMMARREQASSVAQNASSAPQFGGEVVVEPVAGGRRADVAGADHVVAEPFARRAMFGIAAEQRCERCDDRIAADILPIQLVHACAIARAAEIEIVNARTAANEADLRQIRTRAAIR